MRPALITPLTNILRFGWAGVDWDSLVRVASTAEETRSGVDELVLYWIKYFHQMQTISRWVTLLARMVLTSVDMGWDLNTYCTDSEL